MRNPLDLLLFLLISLLPVSSLSAESQIKLTGDKDLVLSHDSRLRVLEVARQSLGKPSAAFMSMLETATSPFVFEQPVAHAIRSEDASIPEVQEASLSYDDADLLGAVVKSFSRQVKGTLARGANRYLQLEGGAMIRPGNSFPVNISIAEGQTFTVTIKEIFSDRYTLQLGEATQTVHLNTARAHGSIGVQLD